jgi:xanthine/uracil permease
MMTILNGVTILNGGNGMFVKQNMLIAVLIGMLVLAFTHLGSSSRRYEDPNTGLPETESFSYIKVFVGTVFAVYILLYLINTSNANTTGGGSSSVAASTSEDARILAHSVDAVLKNIDLSDPKF